MEKDMSVKGWNWGTAKFSGDSQESLQTCLVNTVTLERKTCVTVKNRMFCIFLLETSLSERAKFDKVSVTGPQ